jgi:hypothetical protein
MSDDAFTPKNTRGFDAETLQVLNEAFRILATEYEGRFAPATIHRIMMTTWTGKTTIQRLVNRTRCELMLS